jgi:RNA polymerase sigma factor (sigma-70 family)
MKMMSSDPQKMKNEAAWVCQAIRGDRLAVQRLLETHWKWLKGLTYNILQNHDASDDTLQNICVIVLEKIHTLREPERFKPWLASVARHAALAQREKTSRKAININELLENQRKSGGSADVADALAGREQHNMILNALAELPEKYREVFTLKYIDDMPYARIAEILDLPATTVQIRLVRARRMIYNRLQGLPSDKVPRT